MTQIAEQENLAGLLSPYLSLGQSAESTLGGTGPGGLSTLTQPFNPTMDQLAQTPGYQFTLQQGLQNVANQYSGQGLGNGVTTGATATTPSGPGVKGALNYAQGLAASTYQQQFSNYLNQNAQIFNMEMSPAQLGESSAAAWGGVAEGIAPSIASAQQAGGAATAQGIQSVTGALGSGLSNFALLNSLGGGSLFGGGGNGLTNSDFNGLTDQQVLSA